MTALSNSLVLTKSQPSNLSSGSYKTSLDQCMGFTKLSFNPSHVGNVQFRSTKRTLSVQAGYSDGGRPSSGSVFVGGFILGGLIVGTLGCVYAPQISMALAGADKKDLMGKLPKFIYDEDKALERTRRILAEKIAQLNSAIDDVSSKLQTEDDEPNGNGVAVPDETEAVV